MDLRSLRPEPETPAARTEQLLETYYQRFLKWALALTRGDSAKAEEIVQEFCLYLVLTKPDLRKVANLDGYFYISLRNLYQSSLARSAREAMRFVSVAEFDSIRMALAGNHGGDTLERQNDLRRICNYALWRKDQSKGFCYFILHFFHGYFRREIAEMSAVPLSALYNKLHTARSEIKAHLQDQGKVRILTQKSPPEPSLLWHKIPEADFFKELRAAILSARSSSCLSQEELLARYRASSIRPIPCALLSHIVSCERCLAIVDRHFQRPMLENREPLDSTATREETHRKQERHMDQTKRSSLLRAVQRRLQETYEHRPRTLSIAVNGKIIASHDVQGKHSTLAVRIDSLDRAQFIEVFSEQDVRLALLPIGATPPEGAQRVAQRVELSDDRWLELILVFDGMGLNSEVSYFDPILAIATEETDADAAQDAQEDKPVPNVLPQHKQPARKRRRRGWTGILIPSPAWSWALLLIAVTCVAGYFIHRHETRPMDAKQILNRSARIEAAALHGRTVHQILRIEQISASGKILQQGTVDVWKDGNGNRYLRQLYNSGHHAIAANWRVKDVTHRAHLRGKAAGLAKIPWGQQISVHAFDAMASSTPTLRRVEGDYALTIQGPVKEQPHLVSATLVLNHRLLFVREALRYRENTQTYEVRFVQTEHSYRPSGSVPDAQFQPAHQLLQSEQANHYSPRSVLHHRATPAQLADLEIGVLYQLSRMGADTGEPIEIDPTTGGRLRVLGAIMSNALRQKIVSRLRTLPNHRYLEISLASQSNAAGNMASLGGGSGDLSIYEINASRPPLAGPLVRRHFEEQGLTGTSLNAATRKFSSATIAISQHVLQNAYALHRLGSVFSLVKPTMVRPSSLDLWTRMVAKHASLLETQLHSLRTQLTSILPQNQAKRPASTSPGKIASATQFAQSATLLLREAQQVDHNVDMAFASGSANKNGQSAEALLTSTINMLPINKAAQMKSLAQQLSRAEATANLKTHPQQSGPAVSTQ